MNYLCIDINTYELQISPYFVKKTYSFLKKR